MTGSDIALETRGLTRTFGEGAGAVRALAGIDLVFPRGTFTALMGPSGSGKSTYLGCVGGTDRPSGGRVIIDGRDVTAWDEVHRARLRRDRIGFVFQDFQLMPYLTTAQNVALPALLAGRRPDPARVLGLLERVGLAARAGQLPTRLSGGQRQRVTIARALVNDPAVVLADEPTGALDSVTARGVLALLRSCVDDLGQTLVMVTHDPVAASLAGQRRVPRRRPPRRPDRRAERRGCRRAARAPGRRGGDAMTALDTGPGTYAPSGAARRGGLTGVALRSLRHRPTASAATFVAAALGSTLIGTFATQAQTALSLHGAARADDRATLTILGAVVGAWGTLIVLFAVASTAGLSTLRRAEEIGLLRTLGATPRQARRLLTTEALAIVLVGAVAGAAVALGTGRLLFGLLRGRLVDASVPYGGGAAAVGLAALLVTGASLAAAHLGARRVTQAPPAITLREASTESGPMRWYRVLAGLVLTGYGAVLGVITVTVTGRDTDDPYAAMQTSGSSEILTGLGLALLAPVLLRWLATPPAWLLTRRATAAGQLAAMNTTRRARRLASVAAPVTVLMATATGGAFLATIDARTFPASVGVSDQVVDTVTLVNNVVIGMISLFTALMVANAYAAFTADRRGELRRLWLLGATPGQIRGSVLAEAGVVSLVGVVLGAVGAAATAVPFSIARHEGAVPDQIWIAPLVAGGVILLTVATAGVTVLSPVGRDRGTGR